MKLILLAALIGICSGVLGALCGIGGGIVMVPAFVGLLGLTHKQAVATSMAVQDAVKKAGPVLLEPMMKVEAISPQQYSGDIIGDLNMRRGKIERIENRPDAQVIQAIRAVLDNP